ncbi:hypothetical protein H7X46_23620 [Pseudonocardia sp. C8]|uniref:Uncharacterized protein n=1 Tax=Saccharopolyspora cebuensis TaxID=418759 RepID=A0ABV4CN80_9PSEU|nr:hypothetical protein [Pseudonocardia sp. C8]MBC3194049.1 hypothetical protein [Pseudonocardia sp. C8]
MSETREYRCVIEWDIDAEDPIDAAQLMWSMVKNSPGPIVNVWTDSDHSVEVDLTYPSDTRDVDGRTAENYRRQARTASAVMTQHGRWTIPASDADTHRSEIDNRPHH